MEQAKGIVAQLGTRDMDRAFPVLRRYARDRSERLSHVAQQVVSGKLAGLQLLEHGTAKVVPCESPR
jgi:hypothetical protein